MPDEVTVYLDGAGIVEMQAGERDLEVYVDGEEVE